MSQTTVRGLQLLLLVMMTLTFSIVVADSGSLIAVETSEDGDGCELLRVWLQDDLPQKSTTYHNLPPEGTDCAPIAQYVAVMCNMFDLHHAQSSRRYFNRKYFYQRMRFFIRQACVCHHFALPRCNVGMYCRKMATHKLGEWKNTSSDKNTYSQNIV